MPRTCLACASPQRPAIDEALVSGEPLRNIAKRVSISPAAILRHKSHVANALANAQAQREELLAKMESEGDHRGSIVALREVRECLESLGAMLEKAETSEPLQQAHYDFSVLSDEELKTLETLIAKAVPQHK